MDKSIVKTVKTLSLSVFPSWGGCMPKSLKTAALSLALTLCIAAPVMAEVPVPTLDRVKSEQTTFLDNAHSSYALTELTDGTAAPEGSITVKIADKTYYYTPSENTEVLKTLASTGSAALVETTKDKALYTVGGKYYTYNTEKLKDSGYSLKEATSADEPNTITLYNKETVIKYYDPQTGKEVAAAERLPDVEYKEVPTIQTTPKYYTVSLKQTEYGDKTVPDTKAMYFKWVDDVNGNRQLIQDGATVDNNDIVYYAKTEYGNPTGNTTLAYGWEKNADNGNLEFKQNPTTPVGQTIIYKYNPEGYSLQIVGKTEDNKTITDPPNTSSDNPLIFTSGIGLNNPIGRKQSIDNVLYKDNKVKSELISTSTGIRGKYYHTRVLGAAVSNAGELTQITGLFINNGIEALGNNSYARNYAYGGAMYNTGIIGTISSDFLNNYALTSAPYAHSLGGAIYNDNEIENISGAFLGNYVQTTGSTAQAYGGAIYNKGTIENITNDFIGNFASSTGGASYAGGGAILNAKGTIENIIGDFIGNHAISPSSAYGGAIYNSGTITNIAGDFIGNYVNAHYPEGGAIANTGTIGNITGDFIGNYANYKFSDGGAINNTGTIDKITGDFIGNYAFASDHDARGGAIYNSGIIGNITGNFIGNYVQTNSDEVTGGAIANGGIIGDITGDFIGNYALGTNDLVNSGGAIYNYSKYGTATIGDITGDFIGNYVSSSYNASGGAVYNGCGGSNGRYATIGDITGDFINNYVSANRYAYGGAIYQGNYATIGNITGDFVGNYAFSSGSSAKGGAIYIYSKTIGNITGDFIANYASSSGSSAEPEGGAIYNTGTVGDITGDFIDNYVSPSRSAEGGAIYNTGTIGDITGDFIGNYASGSSAKGGAIYNYGEIGNITGDFIGNYASGASTYGGAIYITFLGKETMGDITGDFIGNYASAKGGAIYMERGIMGDITGDFIGNYASCSNNAKGGAIYNEGTIGYITGDFIGNYASGSSAQGGAIYNVSSGERFKNIKGNFINNFVQASSGYALGGAIYGNYSETNHTNNNFINNFAKAQSYGKAKGGAIFTNYDLTLNADNGSSLISGNYTEINGVKDQNAIYVANSATSKGTISRATTLTLNAVNNGKIQIYDTIAGGSYYNSSSSPKFWETAAHAYTLSLTGDGTGTISLYNDIINANVKSDNVTVDLANNETHDYNFVSMTANDNSKLNIDVDLTNKTADTIKTKNKSTGTKYCFHIFY